MFRCEGGGGGGGGGWGGRTVRVGLPSELQMVGEQPSRHPALQIDMLRVS